MWETICQMRAQANRDFARAIHDRESANAADPSASALGSIISRLTALLFLGFSGSLEQVDQALREPGNASAGYFFFTRLLFGFGLRCRGLKFSTAERKTSVLFATASVLKRRLRIKSAITCRVTPITRAASIREIHLEGS